MADIVSPHHQLDLPPHESLDRHRIEVFYDADLDEMSILFYGREQPNYVDPLNHVLAALRDTGSDMVVGVVFSRFLKQVILDVPESRIFFDDATILTGDHALDRSSNLPVCLASIPGRHRCRRLGRLRSRRPESPRRRARPAATSSG